MRSASFCPAPAMMAPAAVLAASGNQLSTVLLELTVLATLIVYWLAGSSTELLGEHTRRAGCPASGRYVDHSLTLGRWLRLRLCP